MSPPKKRAVVFDFDGVVADSWKLHESSWRKVLAKHGATLDSEVLLKSLGWTSAETARELKKAVSVDASAAELADEKSSLMLKRSNGRMPMMSGIDAALDRLRPQFRLGLTSGRKRDLVDPALARYGLAAKFDLVSTSDDVPAGKEIDDQLEIVLGKLETKADRAIMVDDSRNGLLAAKRAGMRTIAFDSNPRIKGDYAMADSVVKSLDELVPELVNAVIAA